MKRTKEITIGERWPVDPKDILAGEHDWTITVCVYDYGPIRVTGDDTAFDTRGEFYLQPKDDQIWECYESWSHPNLMGSTNPLPTFLRAVCNLVAPGRVNDELLGLLKSFVEVKIIEKII